MADKHPDDPSPAVSRREFTAASVLAILSGVPIVISGCGGGDSSPTAPSGGGNTVNGVVAANHGHVAQVTQVQINAGNDIVLNITGSADHSHTVSITSGELAQIDAGQQVVKISTVGGGDGHLHQVTFN